MLKGKVLFRKRVLILKKQRFVSDMRNGSVTESSLLLNNNSSTFMRNDSQKSKTKESSMIKREKSRKETPSPTKLETENYAEKIVKKDSKYFLNQINHFYESHMAGPTELTDLVLKIYSEMRIKENSFRNKFEDLQNQVLPGIEISD